MSLYVCSFRKQRTRRVKGPWRPPVSAQKALQGSVTLIRELLVGTEESSVAPTRGHFNLPFGQIKIFSADESTDSVFEKNANTRTKIELKFYSDVTFFCVFLRVTRKPANNWEWHSFGPLISKNFSSSSALLIRQWHHTLVPRASTSPAHLLYRKENKFWPTMNFYFHLFSLFIQKASVQRWPTSKLKVSKNWL